MIGVKSYVKIDQVFVHICPVKMAFGGILRKNVVLKMLENTFSRCGNK